MTFDDIVRSEARLIILKALAEQPGFSASDSLLEPVLELYGIRRGRDFIRAELRMLSDAGAVTLSQAGSATIAVIARRGLDHVEHRSILPGVKRPSVPE